MPVKRIRLGDALAALGRMVGLTDEDIAIIDQIRDRSPANPMRSASKDVDGAAKPRHDDWGRLSRRCYRNPAPSGALLKAPARRWI